MQWLLPLPDTWEVSCSTVGFPDHNKYKKYEESAHMSLLHHQISQPSFDISPIWTPMIAAEIRRLQLHQV
jgi:hypothetical protein